jgi:hypothetical protein
MSNLSNTQMMSGLGTATYVAPEANNYAVSVTISAPALSQDSSANSQVVCVIAHNGTPVVTSVPCVKGLQCVINSVAASDTITVTLSSSAAVDQGLNVIKSIITINEII